MWGCCVGGRTDLEQQGAEGAVVQPVFAQVQPLQVGQTGQCLHWDLTDLVVWTHENKGNTIRIGYGKGSNFYQSIEHYI